MTDATGPVTREIGVAVLDLLLERHRVIANNIANQATPGFQPQQLEFERQLAAVRDVVSQGGAPNARALLTNVRAAATVTATGEDTVRIDHEMAALSKNTLQYQALITAIEKLAALDRIGITGE